MLSARQTFVLALLAPSITLAVTTKRTTTRTTSNEPAAYSNYENGSAPNDTIGGSTYGRNSTRSSVPDSLHKHLSLAVGYDFSDSAEFGNRGGKQDVDRAFSFGPIYEFNQITPGLSMQIGGTYETKRALKEDSSRKIQEWTTFGELVAKVTPEFKVVGGLNYTLPSVDIATRAGQSVTAKGRVGFQLGASYQITENIAVDGRYRSLEAEITQTANNATVSQNVTISGLTLGGRYAF